MIPPQNMKSCQKSLLSFCLNFLTYQGFVSLPTIFRPLSEFIRILAGGCRPDDIFTGALRVYRADRGLVVTVTVPGTASTARNITAAALDTGADGINSPVGTDGGPYLVTIGATGFTRVVSDSGR